MARPPGMSAEEYKRFQDAGRRTTARARTESRAAAQGRTAARRAPGTLATVRASSTNNNSARRNARQSTFRASNSLFNKSITGGSQVKRANGKLRGSISGG